MAKIQKIEGRDRFVFQCPGCEYLHTFSSAWEYNGDSENPTVRPSILITGTGDIKRCHLYITDGKIQFLADCDHALAGKTIDMVEITEV